MTDSETALVRALAAMCEQYLDGDDEGFDHQCISAREMAAQQLARMGLILRTARGGKWTEAGRKLLES
ncbi:hypothetical protein [Sphingomicrobium marinum]|uniref:hypothetical protein n=1 Tax=Sphingomicrobium marinum TaxID=1227950 RepID=UPI00223EB532|nr:hypothetical protein [Sphingomicrobium marinum]